MTCKKCKQKDIGQTGEYNCTECGLPTTWDESFDNYNIVFEKHYCKELKTLPKELQLYSWIKELCRRVSFNIIKEKDSDVIAAIKKVQWDESGKGDYLLSPNDLLKELGIEK